MKAIRMTLTMIFSTAILALEVSSLPAEDSTIRDSVQTLRGLRPEKMADEEKKSKVSQIEKAWDVLGKGGDVAARAIKKELAAVRAGKDKDDFFALSASVLLWTIGGPKEADEIARLWREADLTANYNYVYSTALLAASSRDPQVLPMLAALLHDKRGKFFVVQHAMELAWPQTQEFVWNIFGSGGLPRLEEVLKRSQDSAELETAVWLLTQAQQITALPTIRKFARHQDRDVKAMAFECLGIFGHPQDYELLTTGLNARNAEDIRMQALALSRYDDLRAVPLMAALFDSPNVQIREAVLHTLLRLPCPESLAAIRQHEAVATDAAEKKACQTCVERMLSLLDTTWDSYRAKSAVEQQKLFAAACKKQEQRYVLAPTDRRLTRAEFLRAAAEWQKNHRITGGHYAWVEDRHVLAVATADDIPLLLDVRAYVCQRVSDECLDEVRILDRVIQRLGRSRYRQQVGLTTKVEPISKHGTGAKQPK